jgi:glucosylceramidase
VARRGWLWCVGAGLALAVGVAQAQTVREWLTLPDRTALLSEQHPVMMQAGGGESVEADIDASVDDIKVERGQRFQTMDGFGFALTGGSAELMMRMAPAKRAALERELLSRDGDGDGDGDGAGVSYLRVSIGASDMNSHAFTYDDVEAGETDERLAKFSLGEDAATVVPVLREMVAMRPGIKILASSWSAPAWMKDNGSLKGGRLRPERYKVYAAYFVRYLKAMRAQGIFVTAVTMQNEPLNGKNLPSMEMDALAERRFLAEDLGLALRRARLRTEVIVYDHNCDDPEYPEAVLGEAGAAKYAAGSGFHLYAGKVEAMSAVHDLFPAKNIYFTEQMVVDGKDAKELKVAAPEARVMIGATRNWSRNVLLWNLAANAQFGPHTSDGGCSMCEGAVTLEGDAVTRNLAFYVLAQMARFVPPGSVRVGSNELEGLRDVAFVTTEGKAVLVVANTSGTVKGFVVRDGGRQFSARLAAGAAGTFVW